MPAFNFGEGDWVRDTNPYIDALKEIGDWHNFPIGVDGLWDWIEKICLVFGMKHQGLEKWEVDIHKSFRDYVRVRVVIGWYLQKL